MNVAETDQISQVIHNLRSTIYNRPLFMKIFSNRLVADGYAMDVDFSGDEYGGWNVEVTLNRNACINNNIPHDSFSYLEIIKKILIESICIINPANQFIRLLEDDKISSNLLNVIITGPNSIVVRL